MATVEAVVDLSAIGHNIGVLRERSGTAVMAVVKADGYGHGAVEVSRAALRASAAEIGVATVGEALALRSGGITGPVIAWLHTPATDFAAAVRHDVERLLARVREEQARIERREAPESFDAKAWIAELEKSYTTLEQHEASSGAHG